MARLRRRLKLRRGEVEDIQKEAGGLGRGIFQGFIKRIAALLMNNPELLKALLKMLGVPQELIDLITGGLKPQIKKKGNDLK